MRQLLILNAGSSSLKLALFRDGVKVLRGQIDRIGGGAEGQLVLRDDANRIVEERKLAHATHADALDTILDWLRERALEPDAIGHRVVHGGELVTQVMKVDRPLCDALDALTPLAPLHQPHNLAPIRILLEKRPDLPQFVGADTAFHRTLPPLERLIPIPEDLRAGGVRRYGFHGLSYDYITSRMTETDPAIASGRMVICHLGSGCSLCGTVGGASRATTMGFTALEGVPMGTRPGSIDPGVLLYLLQTAKLSPRVLEDALYHRSGLTALSGGDADMRDLLRRTDERAKQAVDYFTVHVASAVVSVATAIGGIDGLVFTAGIGERSAAVRKMICERLEWVAIEVETNRNEKNEHLISTGRSKIPVYVVPTDEEAVIARGIAAVGL